jgi:GTPase SAR1 family protein
MSQKIVNFLDEASLFISSIDQLGGTDKNVGSLLSQLGEWRRKWSEAAFTVGIIGVTSSGKSTVINALMGEKLLVSRIKPSSNTVAECRQGTKISLNVLFEEDSGKAPLSYDVISREDLDSIRNKIASYTDESNNPGNREKVSILELSTPTFRLGNQAILADTPGLSAYGLKNHEDLTWEFFLPSVDLALFLTTTKANSDDVIKSALEKLKDYNKPLLIVQNMKDSVVPKIGNGGVIEYDIQKVLNDHRERLKKIGDTVYRVSPPIIQISATQALESGGYEKSGLQELVKNIEEHLKSLSPDLECHRLKRLRSRLSELVDSRTKSDLHQEKDQDVCLKSLSPQLLDEISNQLDELDKDFVTKLNSVTKKLTDTVDIITEVLQDQSGQKSNRGSTFHSISKRADELRGVDNIGGLFGFIKKTLNFQSNSADGQSCSADGKIVSLLKKIDDLNESGAKQLGDKVNNLFEKSLGEITDLIKNISGKASAIANKLNIEESEFRRTNISNRMATSSLRLEHQKKTRTVRVEKTGVLSWVARKLWNGGYEYREESYLVFNIKAFKQSLNARVKVNMEEYTNAFRQVELTINDWLTRLLDKVDEEKNIIAETEKLRQKLASSIKITSDINSLISKIDKEIGETRKVDSSQKLAITAKEDYSFQDVTTFSVLRPALDLAQLAEMLARKAHLTVRDAYLKPKTTDSIVVGWDADTLEQYVRFFWSDYDTEKMDIHQFQQKLGGINVNFPLLSFNHPHDNMPTLQVLLANNIDWGEKCIQTIVSKLKLALTSPPKKFKTIKMNQTSVLNNPSRHAIVTVLFDSQIGISETNLTKMFPLFDALIDYEIWLCLQSGQSFRNSKFQKINEKEFVEFIYESLKILETHDLANKMQCMLVNDRDIGLTVMADFLIKNAKSLISQANKSNENFSYVMEKDVIKDIMEARAVYLKKAM